MRLVRINILVEGPSEKKFVKQALQNNFSVDDYNVAWYPRIYTTSMDKRSGKVFKGGGLNIEKIINELSDWIKREHSTDKEIILFTTLFDYYKFPKANELAVVTDYEKVKKLETMLAEELEEKIGFRVENFIPYIQLHELEAFMLADCHAVRKSFLDGIDQEECSKIEKLLEIKNPEQINDTTTGHPSARIKAIYQAYDKVADFSFFLNYANFELFFKKMPHFANWLQTLKQKILQL